MSALNSIDLPKPKLNSANVIYGPARPDLLAEETLADLFAATARRHPDAIALIHAERSLTYGELDRRAEDVASHLRLRGAGPGKIVGLWMPRGIDQLVAQLAIAKAGAAWLPMDGEVPADRVQVCLDDAQAVGLVSGDGLAEKIPGSWRFEDFTGSVEAPVRRASPQDPAYVIYTSGSTGKPKGIEITQGSICHFLRAENAVLGVRQDDKVYQGFSIAFDMSFEEIWISYLVGATLWIAPRELAGDPEALPAKLSENAITVLHTVPTLLALFETEIPSLRLINLGGEMCPPALAERWVRPGRPLFNSYGPTEATVTASIAELAADQPVTIGKPLPNYGLLILDPESDSLALAADGEVGELCISGPGVAAGYLGRPELTAEKFIANPWAPDAKFGRLYRTGDLARIDVDGNVQCLGRTDSQIKIRGYRVELGEIEAVIAQFPGVKTNAVVLRQDGGVDQLVAFLVSEGAEIGAAELRAYLGQTLPPYMVPSRFVDVAEMPRLTSGKIDRNALKKRELTTAEDIASDTPQNPAEETLFAAIAALMPGQAVRREADFFADMGGHSLLAARLASKLRSDPRFAHVTVTEIYRLRRVGAIAELLATVKKERDEGTRDWTPASQVRRWRCGLAQGAAVPVLIAVRMVQWLAPFFTYHYMTGDPEDSLALAIAASVGAFLVATLFEFAFAICAKWLIAGRLKPGRYPLWGVAYFRWWLADRIVGAAPVYLLSGSSLYSWFLRALGAKIGRDVIIGAITVRAPDLISIGDRATISNAVYFENGWVSEGYLNLGRIDIGPDACVRSFCALQGNVKIGEFAHIEGQTALTSGISVPAGRVWAGSPVRDAGAFDKASQPERPHLSKGREQAELLFFTIGALAVATLFFVPIFPCFIMIDWIDNPDIFPLLQGSDLSVQLLKYLMLAFPATAALIVGTAFLSALVRWVVLPKMQPGRYSLHSNLYLVKWVVNQIQRASLAMLHGVYATVYAPFWYRLLGAKVGRDAEISTAVGLLPDMLTLGDETFVADNVMLGDEKVDGGWMTLEPTELMRRSFVGNSSYVPSGSILPENVLIGVRSCVPPNQAMKSGETWFGSPPFHLPARETVCGFPDHLTFRPSFRRRIARGLIEAFRIIAPNSIITAFGYTVVNVVMPIAAAGRWSMVIFALVMAGLMFGICAALFVLALKWVLIGRYTARSAPMWTPFVWLSEAVTSMYEGIAIPNFLLYLRGTPWLPTMMRLFGAKIGKGVYLDSTDITEFDCVAIGDHSELNAFASPQTHLFEDRVMKIDHVKIGSQVTLGAYSIVLFGAEVGDRANIGPLSVIMKGEFIPAGTSWQGCPAGPA